MLRIICSSESCFFLGLLVFHFQLVSVDIQLVYKRNYKDFIVYSFGNA